MVNVALPLCVVLLDGRNARSSLSSLVYWFSFSITRKCVKVKKSLIWVERDNTKSLEVSQLSWQ